MTFKFNNVFVNNTSTVTGPYEKEGPLGNKFDKSYDDLYNGEKSWEKAEVKLLEESIDILLNKSNKKKEDIDVIIAGDLLNQISASCYGSAKFKVPFLGIYSACSTSTEGILLGASLIDAGRVKNAIVSVSSHNMASEKQFRNPTEYGAPKPRTATFTTTGGASILLSNTKSKVKVESATIGKICNMDQKDPNNMGAAMAVAAADTIYTHLKDNKRDINYYDLIITGDLGVYGKEILKEYMMSEYGLELSTNYNDSGTMIYDVESQPEVLAGGSGPLCSPLVNYSYTIPLLEKGVLNRVLIVATGALFSPTFVFQKEPILSISHAVSLESVK
ncbi:MAG: stage V sporulation protein AD [Bacilli bacterium]|nr:stage V sporulation protein AD [Bacilli bacterium]